MALLAKVLRKKSKAKKDATSNALQKLNKNITSLRIRNTKISTLKHVILLTNSLLYTVVNES